MGISTSYQDEESLLGKDSKDQKTMPSRRRMAKMATDQFAFDVPVWTKFEQLHRPMLMQRVMESLDAMKHN